MRVFNQFFSRTLHYNLTIFQYLSTAIEEKVDSLITLDKKHSLKGKTPPQEVPWKFAGRLIS